MTRKLMLLVALVAVIAAFAVPAQATPGDWGGPITTTCTTRLDDFPNSPPADPNSDDCDSDVGTGPNNGTPLALGNGAGLMKAGSQVWRGNGPGATRVVFSYDENCAGVPDGAFPVFGSAKGTFLVAGTLGSTPATLVAGFNWQRTGLTATITFGKSVADSTDAGSGLKPIAAGLAGFDTNGDFTAVEVSAPFNFNGTAVGLLQVQVGTGRDNNTDTPVHGNNCIGGSSPPGSQSDVVTAHAVGQLNGG